MRSWMHKRHVPQEQPISPPSQASIEPVLTGLAPDISSITGAAGSVTTANAPASHTVCRIKFNRSNWFPEFGHVG